MKSYFLTELRYQLRGLWKKWAKPAAQCLMALVIAFASLYFWRSDVGQRIDLWILRQFFEQRGAIAPPKDVVIVGIDDVTYQKMDASQRQPFPRVHVAKALQQIVSAKPRVVIIDANIPKERIDLEADQILEDALRAGPTTIWSGIIPQDKPDVVNSDPSNYLTINSEERFIKAAKMELPMLIASRLDTISMIGFDLKNADKLFEFIPLSRALVELGKYEIKKPERLDLINFYGPKGTINRISLYQLLNEEVEKSKEMLKDKVVFLGFQSIGRARGQIDKDEYYISASSNAMFGVEIHANIAANLIDGTWLTRRAVSSEVMILFFFALLFGTLGIVLTPEKSVPLTLVILTSAVGYSYWSFANQNFWHGGIGALVFVAGATILGGALYHYVIIKSFKKYIQKTFKFDIQREM